MTGLPTLPPYLLEKVEPCVWYLHIMGKDGQSEGFFMRLELSTTDLGDEQERADDQATVEFILKACNAHAELVEALRRLRNECDLDSLRGTAGFDCWLNLADKALAKAGAA